MKVFKATNQDMTCTSGRGSFQYRLGEPAAAEKSKCANTGLHACEYVIDCTRYYRLGSGSRFFLAEAEGDIAEDGTDTRIACTSLTLIRELSNRDMAREAMLYMLRHPKREGWDRKTEMIHIATDRAEAGQEDAIAIARGKNPRVKGCPGAHLGLLLEETEGFQAARLFEVDGKRIPAGKWLSIKDLQELEQTYAQ